MAIHLLEAQAADMPAVAALARRIWNQHYVSIIGQAQVDYMLGLFYSPAALAEQVYQKHHRFFMIRRGDENLGFVSVHCEQGKDFFINKFYIDQELAGKGIGSEVFARLLGLLDPASIRLTVNRQNYKSINFYFKNGFIIERVADFDIGEGYVMNDFVMLWKKPGTPS